VSSDHICDMYKYKHEKSRQQMIMMEQTVSDGAQVETDYICIQKGRGFVYAFGNNIHCRVKTEGNTKNLQYSKVGCHASAKLLLFFAICANFNILKTPARYSRHVTVGRCRCRCRIKTRACAS